MRFWRTLALLCCALFLAWIWRFYHPGLGFSALLIIPAGDESQLPALRALPHFEYPPGHAYDGALYVQLAMVPLLRDPAIDVALDAPAYRARRILFCWTAYAMGLGRPAWILQTYALQNVLVWLLLAWLITRWFPPESPRLFALWAASMFAQGLLTSVRMALLDGPSLLLIACAVAAAERGRTWSTAGILSAAALGRETNLLAAVGFSWPQGWRGWLRVAAASALMLVPLLVWQDYIWSIYRGTSVSAGAGHITMPFLAYARKWAQTFEGFGTEPTLRVLRQLCVLVALTVQAIYVVRSRSWRAPWWRVAAAYAVLMVFLHGVVWEGYPGAVTRVLLPMKLAFNVLLSRDASSGFWWWFGLGNLDLAVSSEVLTST